MDETKGKKSRASSPKPKGSDDKGAAKPGGKPVSKSSGTMDAPAKLRAMCLVLSAVVCDYVGVSMMRVALPFYAKALGGSATLIGGIESMYGVGQVVGATVLPRLSDSWGRRKVLTFSCLGSCIGYGTAVAARLVGSPYLLLASRLPVGLAKQTVTVSRAVVADCTDANEERSKWMSWLGTALGIGCVIGPFVGGQVAERLGDIVPAVMAVIIFLALTPVVIFVLPETSPAVLSTDETDKAQATRSRSAVFDKKGEEKGPPLWRSPAVLVALAVLALPELGLVAHSSVTLYTFCIEELGKGKMWIGNLTSVSAILQATFAGVLPVLTMRGWSDVRILQLGVASFAVASLSIWYWRSTTAVVCSAPAAALANAVLRSYPATFLSKRVSVSRQGEAMGLMDLSSSGLRVLAPTLAGLIMDNFGRAAVFTGQASLFIVAGLWMCFLSSAAPAAAADAEEKKKQ
eukprot:gnl/TRDRNA2_/TRDRNA2_41058_c0_seq2.p1 gnl/TRDRNA2_/TRDRNA2_41058_c0~~gnl/TRDRNA2_/TRDRNA2_41058_c0_seq2.p1  ORF type:complete len:460 (+),score=84.48 gnl/TRDRNA2_/TRDRNA2_41058_c0_seq2:76-1455(+)